jgi:transcriptional regulator with XRE-family HTH domain
MELGQKIHDLRVKNNLTQRELSEKLNVTPQAVSRWEQGLVEPSLQTIKQMSEIFNVSADVLIDNNNFVNSDNLPQTTPEAKESPVEVVDKKLVAVCDKCGKKIYEGEDFHHYDSVTTYHRAGRMKKSDTTPAYDLCLDCEKLKEENDEKEKIKQLEKERIAKEKRTKKAWIWSIVCGVLTLIIFIIVACFQKDGVLITGLIGGGIVGSYLIFSLLFCIIEDNNFVGDLFIDIAEFGIVKMPGVIFSLDFDGLVFLFVAKFVLAVISFSLVAGAIILAGAICGLLSMFVFPYSVTKAYKY